MEIKKPARYNRLVSLLQNLLSAQHISGTTMPIIRSSRVIQMVATCGTWRFGLQVVGLVWVMCPVCGTSNIPQTRHKTHTRPTTCKPQHEIPHAATTCITLELLMMGIVVPETC